MISVGIDVSKEKSTVCILKPYGEIVSKPFEVYHVEQELSELATMLLRLNDEVRIIMEATGIYHLPVLSYFKEKGFFVAVINPFEMKEYRCQGLRRVKTDKQDAITISHYGIDHWYRLKEYKAQENIYTELKLLGRQYCHYMRMRVESVLELTHLLDYTMPGIKTLLQGWNERNGKDKLGDFAEKYWHYDNITKKSEKQFIDSYLKWAKRKDTIRTKIKRSRFMHWQRRYPHSFLQYPINKNAGTGGGTGITRSRSYPDDNFNTNEVVSQESAGISNRASDGRCWRCSCPEAHSGDRRCKKVS